MVVWLLNNSTFSSFWGAAPPDPLRHIYNFQCYHSPVKAYTMGLSCTRSLITIANIPAQYECSYLCVAVSKTLAIVLTH